MQSLLAATAAAVLAAACPQSLFPSWVQDLNTLVGLISFAITIGTWSLCATVVDLDQASLDLQWS